MKLSGTHTIEAPPEQVFALLIDPEVLKRCIPGCKEISHKGEGVFDMTVSAGIGPIRGTYTGTVSLTDLRPTESYTMATDIIGPTGFVKGQGTVTIEPQDEGSTVTFEGDVNIGGPLAAVGQRLHQSGASLMIRQLFGAIAFEAQAEEGEEVEHSILGDIMRTVKK